MSAARPRDGDDWMDICGTSEFDCKGSEGGGGAIDNKW